MSTETTAAKDATASGVQAQVADERLIQAEGVGGVVRATLNRIKGGDLGLLPVIVGLVVVCVVFQALEPTFLSSANLVSITRFATPTGFIALGIVLVLLVGEIDLSVGSVAGFSSASMAVLLVNQGWNPTASVLVAIGIGAAIGLTYSLLYTKIGVPSFVFSLAGLLGFEGALLYVLGTDGTINLPRDFWLREFSRSMFLSDLQAYGLVALLTAVFLGSALLVRRRRIAAGLAVVPLWLPLAQAALLAGGLGYFCYYLGIARGVSYLFASFVAVTILLDLALRKTRWGRHVMSVGGNEEAARRSGINVGATYLSVFVLCSTFAAVGGLLLAGQLTSVSQTSGTGDTNLTAIAAAVIGGTSLFGGRGSAYSALLGILVLQSIDSGLNKLSDIDSDVRFMVTGGVLLLAVAIDSVSRRLRSASGRG